MAYKYIPAITDESMQQVMLEFAPRAAAPTAAPTQLRSSGTPKTNDAVPVKLRYSQVYGKKPKNWKPGKLEPATPEDIAEAQRMAAEIQRINDDRLRQSVENTQQSDNLFVDDDLDDETRFYNSLPQGMREYAKANNFYKDQIFTNAEIDAFRNDKFFQRHPEYLENLVRTQHIKKLDDRIKDRQYRDKQRQKWKAENAKYMEEMRKQYGDEAVGLAPGNETFNPNLYRETADFNMKYNPLSFGDYQEYEERNERY
jgi:hypothetical protein